MTYLLDTNILSETRKRQPASGVTSWIAATPPDRLYISVLTLGEIEQGISRIRGRGDNEQAAGLERWLRAVELGFGDRILPVTLPVAAGRNRRPCATAGLNEAVNSIGCCRCARMPDAAWPTGTDPSARPHSNAGVDVCDL